LKRERAPMQANGRLPAGMPARVRVVEVGPRDGLQNESGKVDIATRVALIERLAAAGLSMIESGAFVSPKWVPQMADTAEVLARIRRTPGVRYPVLVPNRQGFDAALRAQQERGVPIEEIAVFSAASETFSQKNTHCTIDQGLARFAEVTRLALAEGWRVRGYVSVAFGCPYEGAVSIDRVHDVTRALLDMGCYEVSIGDTTGVATAGAIRRLYERLCASIPAQQLAGHFHDTWGQATANALAMLEFGVPTLDASVAGLGGCPYSPGATGNVASEDIVYLLHGLGIDTGIDLDALIDAGAFISAALGRPSASRVARARGAQREREQRDCGNSASRTRVDGGVAHV
jgi:hydroxymethylglutaryl-CoA lyase